MSQFSPDLLKERGFTLQPDGSFAKASTNLPPKPTKLVVAARSEKRKQPASSCCHAAMRVSSADEGTSCHICANCGKPCDAAQPKKSPLGMKFERFWQQLGGPELTPEHKFHATRKWRFDFALPSLKIAIEIDGGVFGNGRHNRASGFIKDCEKLNHAAAVGWRVFRLATGMVDSTNVGMIIDAVRESES